MATAAIPFLMFQHGDAEEAMNFYVSLFPGSAVVRATRYEKGMPGPEGTIVNAEFTLAGRTFYCSDSYVRHAFDFTPSLSIFIECESEAELEQAFGRLGEGGEVLMPLDNYGFSRRFGWLNDRFGVSWQLNLA